LVLRVVNDPLAGLFVVDGDGWIPVDLPGDRGLEATRLMAFGNIG
jgi:hypothetical protein